MRPKPYVEQPLAGDCPMCHQNAGVGKHCPHCGAEIIREKASIIGARRPANIAAAAACPFCNPPADASPTIRRAALWLAERARVLFEKNRKYGDSAANPVRVFSRAAADEQIRVRIDDKLCRIMRGGVGERAADEDTAGDLVGYLAILAGLRPTEGEGGAK